jgi:hypothetical protein
MFRLWANQCSNRRVHHKWQTSGSQLFPIFEHVFQVTHGRLQEVPNCSGSVTGMEGSENGHVSWVEEKSTVPDHVVFLSTIRE